jgi:hypothetical protein
MDNRTKMGLVVLQVIGPVPMTCCTTNTDWDKMKRKIRFTIVEEQEIDDDPASLAYAYDGATTVEEAVEKQRQWLTEDPGTVLEMFTFESNSTIWSLELID